MNKIDASHLLKQMHSMIQEMNTHKTTINNPLSQIQTEQNADFSSVLKTSLHEINQQQQKATELSTRFEAGDENVKLSDVMVEIQKSEVSLKVASEIRNKFVGAYQDIMNMPI